MEVGSKVVEARSGDSQIQSSLLPTDNYCKSEPKSSLSSPGQIMKLATQASLVAL